jgi:mannitol/fructose-specific phosphotransferase system IIA component (Ntr-type)
MSHKNMNINELATMLGSDYHDVTRLARRGDIPCQTIRGEFRFNAGEIYTWLHEVLPTKTSSELSQMDAGLSSHRGISIAPPMISQHLQCPAIALNLDARTQNSLGRKLVGLANNTDCVYDSQLLLDTLVIKTLPCGVALLHPNQALPYALAEPIVAIAKTQGSVMVNQGIHTNLFFLCAAQETSHHLHLLTRLCHLLQDQDLLDQLEQAHTPSNMIEAITNAEDALVACAI